MMQDNEYRLIRAARRTLRAEITLFIVIVVITSWSVYALYKISAVNSESIFNFSFLKSGSAAATSPKNKSSGSSLANSVQLNQLPLNDSLYRNQIVQELVAGQRELFDHLEGLRNRIIAKQSDRRSVPSGDQYLETSSIKSRPELENRIRPITNIAELKLEPENLAAFTKQLDRDESSGKLRTNSIPRQSEQTKQGDGKKSKSAHLESSIPGPQEYPGIDSFEIEKSSGSQVNGLASSLLAAPDRQAAESNQDSGESIAAGDTSTQSANDDYYQDSLPDDNNTAISDQDNPSPEYFGPSDTGNQEASNENEQNQQAANLEEPGGGGGETDSPTNGSTDAKDENGSQNSDQMTDDGDAQEESKSIDEEVDRMTQPSSGSVKHQLSGRVGAHQPQTNFESVVQFDDTIPLNPKQNPNEVPKRFVEPGSLIARFEEPREEKIPKVTTKKKTLVNAGRVASDLVFDHNKLITVSNSTKPSSGSQKDKTRDTSEASKSATNFQDSESKSAKKLEKSDHKTQRRENEPIKKRPKTAHRQRRSSLKRDGDQGQDLELSKFSPVDQLVGLDSSSRASVNNPEHPLVGVSSIVEKHPKGNWPSVSHLDELNTDNPASLVKSIYETLNEDQTASDSKLKDSKSDGQDGNLNVTANLDDLLTQRQLLDELNKTLLSVAGIQDQQYKELIGDKSDSKSIYNAYKDTPDHQKSESYGHGYGHKKKKKKKKKKIKKKSKKNFKKKKETMAVKKGGHKKKKHEKDLKKVLKEKKFKGAKKGKKMSKGRGGQGGKKGKKYYKDKGYKKNGFKKIYHKEEFGQKKSYFDEFRDKDFKKKWKKFDDNYNYAQMKKWQAKNVKGDKKVKDFADRHKKYDKGKWKKMYQKKSNEESSSKKSKKYSF